MSTSRYALAGALLLLLALPSVSQCDQPLLPQAGILVLRSGRVLRGNILYEGDRYVIGLGDEDQVSVPQTSVLMHCDSLEEAYQRQRDAMRAEATAAEHLQLADWCLRYELTDSAAEQLLAAQRIAPQDPAIGRFERRLRTAVTRPAPARSNATSTTRFVSAAELDEFVRELPVGTVERFTCTIQPLLINRCGAGGCHGPTADSALKLFFSNHGGTLPRRFTQRNLQAVHAYLDLAEPANSRLLLQAVTAHGGTSNPPVDQHADASQLDDLLEWVQMHVDGSRPPTPSVVSESSSLLLQPLSATGRLPRPPGTGSRPDPLQNLVDSAVRPASHQAADTATLDDSYRAVDPFDPEIFNRRYGPRR